MPTRRRALRVSWLQRARGRGPQNNELDREKLTCIAFDTQSQTCRALRAHNVTANSLAGMQLSHLYRSPTQDPQLPHLGQELHVLQALHLLFSGRESMR